MTSLFAISKEAKEKLEIFEKEKLQEASVNALPIATPVYLVSLKEAYDLNEQGEVGAMMIDAKENKPGKIRICSFLIALALLALFYTFGLLTGYSFYSAKKFEIIYFSVRTQSSASSSPSQPSLSSSTPSKNDSHCPNEWETFEDLSLCWKYFSMSNAVNWSEAFKTCQSFGATLIVLDSDKKFNYIKNQTIKNVNRSQLAAWVGSVSDKPLQFDWLNGVKIDKSYWSLGNPSNSGGHEACVAISELDAFKLNDADCSDSFDFICELTTKAKLDAYLNKFFSMNTTALFPRA